MRKVLLIFIILFVSSHLLAATSNPCEDLASIACSDEKIDDGTGTTTNVDAKTKLEKQINTLKPKLTDSFLKLIKSEKGKYLRDSIMSVYNLGGSPLCSSDKVESEECYKNCAESLADLHLQTEVELNTQAIFSFTVNAALPERLSIIRNSHFKSTVEQFAKEFEAATPHKWRNKIESEVFPRVVQLLKERIRLLPIDEKTKSFMLTKVENIRYTGLNCSVEQSSGLFGALVPNAFYSPQSNEFSLCHAFVEQYPSEFAIAGVIIHELAHAVDPCNIAVGPSHTALLMPPARSAQQLDNYYLRENFLACLRSEKSMHAQRPSTYEQKTFTLSSRRQQLTSQNTLPSAQSLTPISLPPSFCVADQITEAVPDWFLAEVLPEYIQKYHSGLSREQKRNGLANALRLTCSDESSESDTSIHPKVRNRINGAILVQPKVRKLMGCSAAHNQKVYCDIDNPAALEAIVKNIDANKSKDSTRGSPNQNSGTKR